MSTTELPPIPSKQEVDASIKLITDNAQRIFCWNYDRSRDQLVTLYNKAMASQWNSVTELDWSIEVDPEQVVRESPQSNVLVELARAAAEVDGSPLKSWGEKEFLQLGIESIKAQLSPVHARRAGRHDGGGQDRRDRPVDRRRATTRRRRRWTRPATPRCSPSTCHLKLGEAYPMSPFLEEQIDALITDSRWDIAYLGMQIVIESLALAAFGAMPRATEEPLLKKLLRYVMADEARHVAFGVLSLAEYYGELSDAELKDRQEFLAENTLRSRDRSTTPEIWERMGVKLEDVLPSLLEAMQKLGTTQFAGFQRAFFAKLVPNVRKLGLLDANNGYLRQKWGEAGLLEFEFADDTGSDYETYDEVAKDRAAAAAAATFRQEPP